MKLFMFSFMVVSQILKQAYGEQCQSSGFRGCECNFLGACNLHQIPVHGLDDQSTGYAPTGMEQFRYSTQENPSNLAYICERGSLSILFDCNAKIALYSATVITGTQLTNAVSCGRAKGPSKWKASSDARLQSKFQQETQDYTNQKERLLCYETSTREFATDIDWFKAKNHGLVPSYACNTGQNFKKHEKAPMTRGHLIASMYSMGDEVKRDATFTLTNIVPQFDAFNTGPWQESEQQLISWGQVNCASPYSRMFVVVGTIPSTFGRSSVNPRFFGASGFSEFQGMSHLQDTYMVGSGNREYRINVPIYVWTAACCTTEYSDERGQHQVHAQSVAFYRRNNPSAEENTDGTPAEMWAYFKSLYPEMTIPTLFPQHPHC